MTYEDGLPLVHYYQWSAEAENLLPKSAASGSIASRTCSVLTPQPKMELIGQVVSGDPA
jgi:hypothetical protein